MIRSNDRRGNWCPRSRTALLVRPHGELASAGSFKVEAPAARKIEDLARDFAAVALHFAQHLLEYVPVMGLINRVLDERPSHTAPEARFRNELEDYMSEDYADETLKTIVSWGRYAELFAYDEQSETFSLENPH